MTRLLSLIIAAAFALTTSAAFAADVTKTKADTVKADDKKPTKKKKESC